MSSFTLVLHGRTGGDSTQICEAAVPSGERCTDADRYASLMSRSGTATIAAAPRVGGSTWRSVMRGGSVEVDYPNGEIVALGKGLGIATPANATVQRLCSGMAAAGEQPGRFSAAEWLRLIEADGN